MNARTNLLRPCTLVLAALLAAGAAQAATSSVAEAQRRHQRDVAACARIAEPDARSNCLSEAHTRLAQVLPTPPSEAPAVLAENALKRCARLPGDLRTDCEARMRGEGTTSGSVDGGGIYRELVIRTVEPVTTATSPSEPGTGSGTPPVSQ